jgi:flagellar biosynthesis protein FliQ
MDLLMEHMGKGIIVMLILSMPSVLTAAAIGLVIGILQAVTQVQEQTIAAAPKILGVFLAIMILGGFSMNILQNYFIESSNIAFNIIPRDEEMVLPPSSTYAQGAKIYEEEFYGEKKPEIKDIMKNPGKVPYSDQKYKQSYTKTPKDVSFPPNFIESKKIHSGN